MSAIPLKAAVSAERSAADGRATVQVWDLPLRLFHWSLVLAILAAFTTGKFGGSEWAQWHGRIGEFILGLLIFRVSWGIIGTRNARFLSFLPTPARLRAYVRGRWQGDGHNPLGALSVIALLLLVGVQVTTGIFANDDIAFAGPWADRIGKQLSDALTSWHQDLFYVLAGFIVLHIAAILFYLLARRANLIVPMITGRKPALAHDHSAPSQRLWWRFAIAVAAAFAITWLVFHPISAAHTEAATPAATPDW